MEENIQQAFDEFPNRKKCSVTDINSSTSLVTGCSFDNNVYTYYTSTLEDWLETYIPTFYNIISQNLPIKKTGNKENTIPFSKRYNINLVFIETLLDPYHTNSERTKSRCIPRYTWKMWSRVPDPVWIDDGNPNYYV